MSRGDFHTHSTRSDGTLAPAELVRLAWRNGVRVLALTDHDTLEGIAEAREAAADLPGMRLVPGVELSCDLPGTELHILGLFVDPEHAAFTAELARFREGRVERGRAIVGALERLGAPIDWRRVQEIAGDASIGRPHIAQEVVEELRALALSLDLFPLGGSDYHALAGEGGREPGDIPLPDDVVEQLLDEVRRRGCRVPEPALPRAGGPPP